ncbi:DoxX family protein [Hymenobacter jeollabukensis]|uniref:DoxX family protein n=1 Tax=Hymenobacter jeollabukensis TaxID=2025313 RepID=A0A5R8WX21_9BACT|nr:DoxX family protein [Hymenobacter jeollabukensis]TLM96899.1 DoxX family protein [Hymenobacter jeollabukensis]
MLRPLFLAAPLGPRALDAAYLLFRLHLGLSIAIGAGWSKLINLSTTRDLAKLLWHPDQLSTPDWFVQQVAGLGFTFPSPYFWAALAVWGELLGGLLIALGLATRLAAAQLAVQFLVIAFFWYETPEPVLGMYYQQLLFWAFVLVTALGGGRFSLDYLLSRPRRTPAVRGLGAPALAVIGLWLICATAPVQAQAPPADTPAVRLADFRPLLRYDWQGTLTYLDYQSQRPVTLVTRLNGMQAGAGELVLDYQYQEPEGGLVKGFERLRLRPDGHGLVWDELPMRLHQRTARPDSTLQLVLVGEGRDDNRPATIRRTVLIGARRCRIRKEVRFAGQTDFLQRNEYQFTR